MSENKKIFLIKMYMFITFGLMTELIVTAIGGNLIGFKDYHQLTLMGNVSLWMSIVYFLAFPLLNKFNDSKWACNKPMIIQTLIGGLIIGAIEFISGVLFNLIFGLNCWNYINEFMNLYGQICLKNYILFTLAYPLAIWLIDTTEWALLKRRPELNYSVLRNYIKLFTFK